MLVGYPNTAWGDPLFSAVSAMLTAGDHWDPETEEGWSPGILLALGGGPGLTWEAGSGGHFELSGLSDDMRTVVPRALRRLGLEVKHAALPDAPTLGAVLQATVNPERPVLCWSDGSLTPEHGGTDAPRPVVVLSVSGDSLVVDLGARLPVELGVAELAAADLGGLMWVETGAPTQGRRGTVLEALEDAVKRSCHALLVNPSRTAGLPALRRLFEEVRDGGPAWACGDPGERAERFGGLARDLRWCSDGTAWRALWSRLLFDLSERADNEDLFEVAEAFAEVGKGWAALAGTAATYADAGSLDDKAWAAASAELEKGLRGLHEAEMRATSELQQGIY